MTATWSSGTRVGRTAQLESCQLSQQPRGGSGRWGRGDAKKRSHYSGSVLEERPVGFANGWDVGSQTPEGVTRND